MLKPMIGAALLAFTTVLLAHSVGAQTPPACYQNFPGARGNACCDKSYRARPEGTMPNTQRWAQVRACAGVKAPPCVLEGQMSREERRRTGTPRC